VAVVEGNGRGMVHLRVCYWSETGKWRWRCSDDGSSTKRGHSAAAGGAAGTSPSAESDLNKGNIAVAFIHGGNRSLDSDLDVGYCKVSWNKHILYLLMSQRKLPSLLATCICIWTTSI